MITSVWEVIPEPPASPPVFPSATTHHCQNFPSLQKHMYDKCPCLLQQAYTHLPSRAPCLLLTWRERGFISPNFSFLKLWFLDSQRQTDIYLLVENQPNLRKESQHTWLIPGGSREIKSLCRVCYHPSSLSERKNGGRKLPQVLGSIDSREALSLEECLPSHLAPIHQSTLLPNPRGPAVPELQNHLPQACVSKGKCST